MPIRSRKYDDHQVARSLRARAKRASQNPRIEVFYQITTEESVEHGDYADHGEHEVIQLDSKASPEEMKEDILHELRQYSIVEGSSSSWTPEHDWFVTEGSIDFQTGETTTYSIFLKDIDPEVAKEVAREVLGASAVRASRRKTTNPALKAAMARRKAAVRKQAKDLAHLTESHLGDFKNSDDSKTLCGRKREGRAKGTLWTLSGSVDNSKQESICPKCLAVYHRKSASRTKNPRLKAAMARRKAADKAKVASKSEGWVEIVFLQNSQDAEEPLQILENQGEEAAIKYLSQWDYGGENEHSPTEDAPWGSSDKTFEQGDYVLSWNSGLGYIGLARKVELDEDGEVVSAAVTEASAKNAKLKAAMAKRKKKAAPMQTVSLVAPTMSRGEGREYTLYLHDDNMNFGSRSLPRGMNLRVQTNADAQKLISYLKRHDFDDWERWALDGLHDFSEWDAKNSSRKFAEGDPKARMRALVPFFPISELRTVMEVIDDNSKHLSGDDFERLDRVSIDVSDIVEKLKGLEDTFNEIVGS